MSKDLKLDYEPPPPKPPGLTTKQKQLIGVFEIVAGLALVYLGRDRIIVGGLPVPWVGWCCFGFGLLCVSFPNLIKFED